MLDPAGERGDATEVPDASPVNPAVEPVSETSTIDPAAFEPVSEIESQLACGDQLQ